MLSDDRVLINEVESTYRQFMFMPNEHCFTVASLWVMHTHLRDHSGTFLPQRTPRLVWLSKVAGAGKTLGMELTSLMSHNGEIHTVPTQFALVSAINQNLGTVALDEIDKFLGNRGTGKQDIQAILNNGYKRGAYVTRQRNDEVEYQNCCGPFQMAGKNANRFMTSDTFETLRTRSIPMLLERKPVGTDVDKFKSTVHEPRIRSLSTRIKRWGMLNSRAIVSTDVEYLMPAGIDNRDEEIWTVLFQIANFIGGDWPRRIERAARAFILGEWDEAIEPVLSPGEELLAECRAAFADDIAFLPTVDILRHLMVIDGWWRREWKNPKAASMGLARTLGVFGIEAERQSHDGVQTRGYSRLAMGVDVASVDPEADDDDDALTDASEWDWSTV